jgi:ribonuclease HI
VSGSIGAGSTAPDVVDMWTDGACKGNPGPGGWGALIRWDGVVKELYGGDPSTTNNRMELTAVIEGLRALKRPCTVRLHVDSVYVMNGMKTWIHGWKRNGWRTSGKQAVKNAELWQALDAEVVRHDITWIWVRGHAGDPGNERADELANLGVASLR